MAGRDAALSAAVGGRVVLVTGASDGIGARLAARLGSAGARVLLVARTAERLREVGDAIRGAGGVAFEHPADLSRDEDVDRVVREVLAAHGHVDVFVSNAGRSIRRSAVFQGGDRFHDFQRLMALNFFGALRMTLGLLPRMIERHYGHIVHVSSFGVPTRQPRFAGYNASKSAFDVALQSIAGEVSHRGIRTSSVYMPLVQTKMAQPRGHSYEGCGILSRDEACEYIEHAIVSRKYEVVDTYSRFLAFVHFFRPSLVLSLNSMVYRSEGEQPSTTDAVRAHVGAESGRKALMAVLFGLSRFCSRLDLMLSVRRCFPAAIRDAVNGVVFAGVLLAHPRFVGALMLACCFRRVYGSSALRPFAMLPRAPRILSAL